MELFDSLECLHDIFDANIVILLTRNRSYVGEKVFDFVNG